MRRRPGGFLLVEITVALSIFCGVLALLLVGLQQAAETTALEMERTRAACRLERTLAEVRRGIVELTDGGDVTLPPPAPEDALPDETCIVGTRPWDAHPQLRRVTVTVQWRSRRRREAALTAETVVRATKLKFAGVDR